MAHVVSIHAHGGPEVLKFEQRNVGDPGPKELRIRQTRCGVNFIDTYFRSGLYPVTLPFILGQEAAGEVLSVGTEVTGFQVGDRVSYSTMGGGGYASERVIASDAAFKVPEWVSDEVAAALTMKGLTAHMLLRQTFKVVPDTVMLVHAAAGGVGTLLSQWGSYLGATVIGTVGSDDKVEVALANGCRHVIVYSRESFADRVKDITKGELCDVVYDGVGKTTAMGSLDCLRPRGMFVSYGNASGPVEPFSMLELAKRGSLFATRPMMPHYASTEAKRDAMAAEFFGALKDGGVKAPPIKRFALSDAADAHRELESRRTAGCLVLVP
ncbi:MULTISPECIES: quinone oxidoreductase [unclassified Variovorax]|jgi:NADPH2:quinone reductase|uniref:quinone oxidoreductase family protein n=1 Tax=unclassified Variovorax TaxID=663243 RepID=UPI0008B6C407|nr:MULTISPECIES: quinone oxidoreductase [unclassified Variovorax]SEK13146.1 NADPH2:quinone reductase [Variovorax sp. OK202]SFD87387.1 NADPH2:quinone reductase [Variovorax sp. OK212]